VRRPELLEGVERSLARLARALLLPCPPPDDAQSEQCSSLAECVSDAATAFVRTSAINSAER